MKAFDTSSLWRISDFRRARSEGRLDLASDVERPTLLPTTLLDDLRKLQADNNNGDVLEVMAACVRNHEAALLYLEQGAFVWPVTLFPREGLYHSPRDAVALADQFAMSGLRVLGVEPPGVRAPGSVAYERVASPEKYRPLAFLLWTIAMQGPRAVLLTEISGRAAYRVVAPDMKELPSSKGAVGSAVQRLRQESASLSDIAGWPGMSVERASRLVNAFYLCGALLISRSHPAAATSPAGWRRLLGRRK